MSHKLINYLMLIWVVTTFWFYCYYHHIFGIFFLILFFIVISFFTKFLNFFKKNISDLIKILLSKQQNISFKNFFIILLILSWTMTNLFLIICPLDFSFKNIIFYQLNIIQKIISIFLFYIIFFILSFTLGQKILKLFKFHFNNWGQSFIFSLGLGLIPFMFYILALAAAKILYPVFVWLFVFFIFIWLWPEIKLIFLKLNQFNFDLTLIKHKDYVYKLIIFIFLIIILSINFVIIFKPAPISTDDLSAYFNVPYNFVLHHKYMPYRLFPIANMGQNTEMLYAGVISILGPAYIAHFQFFFFVLCLFGFYYLIKEVFGDKQAVLSLLTISLVPWNRYYLGIAKVEFFLSFYSLLMLFSCWLWYKKKFQPKYLYLLSVFAGISLGIKYNAALLIMPLFAICFFFIVFYQQNRKQLLKSFFLSLAISIALFLPWAVKNYYYFHAPLYPFFVFKGSANNTSTALFSSLLPAKQTYIKSRAAEVAYLRHSVFKNRFKPQNIIKIIWNQSVGKNINYGLWINFGFIPLLILPFFFFYLKDKKIALFLTIIIIYFSLWYILEGVRPWYAFFGFMMIYALLPYLFVKNHRLIWAYLPGIIIVFLAFIYVFTANILYLAGAKNNLSYIKELVPYYQTAKFINQKKITAKSKIFLAGDFRIGFIDNNYNILPDQYLNQISYALNQGDRFCLTALRSAGFKYILYSQAANYFPGWLKNHNITMAEYLKQYRNNNSVPSIYEDYDLLKKFLAANAKIIFQGDFYTLYKIND